MVLFRLNNDELETETEECILQLTAIIGEWKRRLKNYETLVYKMYQ